MAKHKILYYISSHGYGHAARAGQVIKELLGEYEVHIKTIAPDWLLEQVIGEKPLITPIKTDVGCIQQNNHDVDVDKTLQAYQEQSLINKGQLESELAFIHGNDIRLIISDIASFPCVVAQRASIPSLFIGNFTWKGIYNHYLPKKEHPILAELHEEYGMATKALITPLAMDMPEFHNQSHINLIARKGEDKRNKLYESYDIPRQNKLVFFYTGNLGIEEVRPEVVSKIEEYTFLSFYPLRKEINNFICLEKGSYRHQDIMASSDIALIKAGYGMLSEALVNNIPVVFPPRPDFAEYFAFTREFGKSGGYVSIEREDFDIGNWETMLNKASKLSYNRTFADNGALQCKSAVHELLNGIT